MISTMSDDVYATLTHYLLQTGQLASVVEQCKQCDQHDAYIKVYIKLDMAKLLDSDGRSHVSTALES
jgi:hypothetical protein